MQIITLPGTNLRLFKFIFGTANLLNYGSKANRQKHLFKAVDAGFSHFDTSPYYGFGIAEKDLASVLRARPELTFTTKVGLFPPGGSDAWVGFVLARKLLGKACQRLARPVVDFTLSAAKKSLADSLRRTGRERID